MLVLGALFSFSDILIFGVIASALVGGALYAWPWSRHHGRFLVGAGGTLAGWMAWNLVLSENNASSLDIDAPVVALSWQDVGSGVGSSRPSLSGRSTEISRPAVSSPPPRWPARSRPSSTSSRSDQPPAAGPRGSAEIAGITWQSWVTVRGRAHAH